MGSIVEVVGEVVVQGQARGMHVGTISQVFRPAFRGDRVGPIADMVFERFDQSNNIALRGYVMGAAEDPRLNLGQHDLVFIDKGNKDGVRLVILSMFCVVKISYQGPTIKSPMKSLPK